MAQSVEILNSEGGTLCAHCGLSVATDGRETGLQFCCLGCRAVYSILHQSGLENYYQIKKEAYCIRPPQPAAPRVGHFQQWDSEARNVRLFIEGVHCSACLWLLEKLPAILSAHVLSAQLDLGHSLLHLNLTATGQLSHVAELIESWGYRPHLIENDKQIYDLQKNENRARLVDLGVAGALAGNIMLMSVPLYAGVGSEWAHLFMRVAAALATVSVFYSGRSFLNNIWQSARAGRFSIDAPIMLAILVAYFYSLVQMWSGHDTVYFDSLSTLIFLLLASRYLLSRLRQYGLGQKESFRFVTEMSPYQVGERVVVNEPTKLTFDGVIRSGVAIINTSILTGEGFPREFKLGELVFAGTEIVGIDAQNQDNLIIEVIGVGRETRIEKILRQIHELTQSRSDQEIIFERWAKVLLFSVLLVAGGVFAYWAFAGQMDTAMNRALALLIVTCPCALALAAPLAQTYILQRALQNGLLIRDINSFEQAADLRHVIFDKTGTLTYGQMQIEEINISKSFYPLLRALTEPSHHPVAKSVLSAIGNVLVASVKDWTELPGHGISATFRGEKVTLMKPKNMSESDSRPAVELIVAGDLVGQIFFNDRMRSDAAPLVQRLRSEGYSLELLSGDRNAVVNDLAEKLDFRKSEVLAEARPEDKAKRVEENELSGRKCVFIGDGVNDALAMSHATISFAVHGGVENVLKSASVTSIRSGLGAILDFFSLAKQLRSLHKMNFIYSTSYNIISGGLAVAGYMNPLLAAIIMPLSAVTVFVATTVCVKNWKCNEVINK